jgi:hypothetical protein
MRVLNIEAIRTYSKPSKELIEVTEPLSHLLTNDLNILPDPVALLFDLIPSRTIQCHNADNLSIHAARILSLPERFFYEYSENFRSTFPRPPVN